MFITLNISDIGFLKYFKPKSGNIKNEKLRLKIIFYNIFYFKNYIMKHLKKVKKNNSANFS